MFTVLCVLIGGALGVYGLASLLVPERTASVITAIPRKQIIGNAIAPVAWFWTAYELDVIGIEIFDRFLKIFPGQLYVMAAVLTVLTIMWMPNLLPVRALCALFMLLPARFLPLARLVESDLRLGAVTVVYLIAVIGMVGMFYPWHIRRAITWRAASLVRMRIGGLLLLIASAATLAGVFA